jgi:hypothetical protein
MFRTQKCPNCGSSEISPDLQCLYCGTKLYFKDDVLIISNSERCGICGIANPHDNEFCEKCGNVLKVICPFCYKKHSLSSSFCSKTGGNLADYIKKKGRFKSEVLESCPVCSKKNTFADDFCGGEIHLQYYKPLAFSYICPRCGKSGSKKSDVFAEFSDFPGILECINCAHPFFLKKQGNYTSRQKTLDDYLRAIQTKVKQELPESEGYEKFAECVQIEAYVPCKVSLKQTSEAKLQREEKLKEIEQIVHEKEKLLSEKNQELQSEIIKNEDNVIKIIKTRGVDFWDKKNLNEDDYNYIAKYRFFKENPEGLIEAEPQHVSAEKHGLINDFLKKFHLDV